MAVKLLTAQDANWNLERGAFNILIDQRPVGIAVPQSADEVSEVVRSAAADGKRVAAQCTGHLAAPLGSLTGTVLLRTAGLGGVQIDADAGTARVGAGALWSDLVPRASELGLAALHGSAENVGITGYTLGGGLSFYARKHGLACNRVRAIELVTAGGEQVRVDAENGPDLFWALRGGGGSFGVVTALEFDLLPMPEIFAGALFFPAEQVSDVLHGWREWTGGVPEEMTSVWRLLNFPPIPEVPEPLRGRSFTAIEAIYCGDPADGEELVGPLRELGSVAMDSVAVQPPAGIAELHMDPPEPVPYWGDSILIGELPAAAIDSLLEAVGPGSGSQLLSVELRHCGGALSRTPPGAGALATLPGSFFAFGVGFVPVPEAMARTRGWVGSFKAALEPYDAGIYLNFAEEPFEMTKAFPAKTVDRLREVKQRYDPEDLFQSNHPVTG
ncbi:MAG TPA: FAD-binding oxidoreductase [Propionibacteriaceae bacterium]|nr:FAD-binding oxidoreductase [Propionibacteriaceae bacterium]